MASIGKNAGVIEMDLSGYVFQSWNCLGVRRAEIYPFVVAGFAIIQSVLNSCESSYDKFISAARLNKLRTRIETVKFWCEISLVFIAKEKNFCGSTQCFAEMCRDYSEYSGYALTRRSSSDGRECRIDAV